MHVPRRYDELVQPTDEVLRRMTDAERSCFFVFVDAHSHALLLQETRARGSVTIGQVGSGVGRRRDPTAGGERGEDGVAAGAPMTLTTIGVWRLVPLADGALPFASSRRNSRVPKMLAHRLFPRARYAVWVDSKLRLHQPPATLRRVFLPDAGVTPSAHRTPMSHDGPRPELLTHPAAQ